MKSLLAPRRLEFVKRAFAAVAFSAVALAGNEAQAATNYYWNSTGTSTWTTTTSWSNTSTGTGGTGAGPTSSTDAAVFNGTADYGPTVAQLSGPQTTGFLTFNNTGSTTLESSSSTAQTLNFSGGSGALTVAANAGAVTIGDATNVLNLNITAVQSWTNSSANAVTVVNNITGTGAVAIHLNGKVFVFDGASALAGSTTTIDGSNYTASLTMATNTVVVHIANAAALGTGAVDFRGTLQADVPLTGANKVQNLLVIGTGAGTIAGSNNIELSGGLISAAGTGTAPTGAGTTLNVTNTGTTTLTGTVSLSDKSTYNNSLTVNATGGLVTISGTIQNYVTAGSGLAGTLTKSGAGTLLLSGANTYSGGTSVTGGRLLATNTTSSSTGTGPVSVSNAAVLGGSGKVSGAVTLNAGSMLYSGATASTATTTPGTGAVSGTTGGMTLSSTLNVNGATLSFDLANSSGASSFASPALSTSYLTVSGLVSFTGTDTIDLVDLSNGGLTLRQQNPYLLIAGSSYFGLVIKEANGTVDLSQNGAQGTVLGVWTGTGTNYVAFNFNQYGSDGVTALSPTNAANTSGAYISPYLYLSGGNLEVVPEPKTWVLMIAGLALLVVVQRRKKV